MHTKLLIGSVMTGVAVILLILTFFLPWFNVTSTMESSYYPEGYEEEFYEEYKSESKTNAYFSKSKTEIRDIWAGNEDTHSYERDYLDGFKATSIFGNTRLITIIAIIAGIVALIGIFMVGKKKMDTKIGVILVVIGFIVAILGPIYLMISLPGAIGDDSGIGGEMFFDTTLEKMSSNFFGSDSIDYEGMIMETTWGGAISWYLALIAAILIMLAVIPVYLYISKEEIEPDESTEREFFEEENYNIDDFKDF